MALNRTLKRIRPPQSPLAPSAAETQSEQCQCRTRKNPKFKQCHPGSLASVHLPYPWIDSTSANIPKSHSLAGPGPTLLNVHSNGSYYRDCSSSNLNILTKAYTILIDLDLILIDTGPRLLYIALILYLLQQPYPDSRIIVRL